ncbi:MAG: YlxR family protein [Ruminococcaceae bacterium]|nr:YlxR family protein [Oscillospiraceae bacterium]
MAATQEKPKKKMPERKCVGCNERKPKNELVRVLRTPEGEIQIDRTGKKSGRGAYLCRSTACFAKAVKARRLQTALECEIPDNVIGAIEKELTVCDG